MAYVGTTYVEIARRSEAHADRLWSLWSARHVAGEPGWSPIRARIDREYARATHSAHSQLEPQTKFLWCESCTA